MGRLREERKEKILGKTGITMAMDEDLLISSIPNIVDQHGKYFELVKLSGAFVLDYSLRENRNRIDAYKSMAGAPQIEVFCGGVTFETFGITKIKEFIKLNKDLGLNVVEVSNGDLEISEKEKVEAIRLLKEKDFKVISEIGESKIKKNRTLLTEKDWLKAIELELKAGSKFVILQSGKEGRVGVFDENRKLKEGLIQEISKNFDVKKIIFEAPHLEQQTCLINMFGANVNIGNIRMNYVAALEHLRTGRRRDTFEPLSGK